jgi:carbon monoxide dehydrogenase subunit G
MKVFAQRLARIAAVATTFAAGAALASGDRIIVVSSDAAVREQLTETLCVSQECVPAQKFLTAGKADFAKVAREGLTAVVTGRLSKSGAAYSLEVLVQNRAGATRLSRTVPANSEGKVSIVDVVSAASQVITVIEQPESKDVKVAKAPQGKTRVAQHAKGKVGRKVATRPATGRSRG